MKIKALVVLGALGLAPVLAACGQEEQAATYCVDAAGTVLDEDYCDPDNDHYSPAFIVWESHDSHKFKKGKKIPGAVFRKGTTSKPSSSKPKASVGKSDTKKESPKPKSSSKTASTKTKK